jgi:hypothetical protein
MFMLALTAMAGAILLAQARTARVRAADLEIAGTLRQEADGSIALDDGEYTRGAIGAVDLAPFVGKSVGLTGDIVDDTVFLHGLTLGSMNVAEDAGLVKVSLTGTVRESGEGYEVTVDGVVFTLIGDTNQLRLAVGKVAQIEGQLTATWVSVVSMST